MGDTANDAPAASRANILLLVDRRGWAFDAAARALVRHLGGEFEFRIAYVEDAPDLGTWPCDLVYVFFWGETYHRLFVEDPARVIKEVSSHRWALEPRFGRLPPSEMTARYLSDAGTITATSRRLTALLAPHREVSHVLNGFDPTQLRDLGGRAGPLTIGWAGNVDDPCKGVKEFVIPAAAGDFTLRIAGGDRPLERMAQFYNEVDVLSVASSAEGEPLTLIEAMACGCFPVCTDVGIVPELVEHRVNGLIVERSVAAFRAAFYWCARNVEQVRAAGRRNAEVMVKTRAWENTVASWRRVFLEALARRHRAARAGHARPMVTGTGRVSTEASAPRAAEHPARKSQSLALLSAAVRGDNSGDALIEDAIRRLLRAEVMHTFPLLQRLDDEQIERINACDAAIVCGTNLYQHVFACALSLDVLGRIRVPIVPLGIGASAPIGRLPKMDTAGTKTVRALHERCSMASVRDPLSLDFVRGLGIRNVELTGCPVLFHALSEPRFEAAEAGVTCVSIRARLLHVAESYRAKEIETLRLLAEVLRPLIVIQSPYDLEIAFDLVRHYGLECLFDAGWSHAPMLQGVERASRTAGFRLHFGMLSLSYGRPAVLIATDTRVAQFCTMMGLRYHDIATYRPEDVARELAEPPAAVDRFLINFRMLRSTMASVLTANALSHVLA